MDEEEIDFKVEAEAVMQDIGFAVQSINISEKMPSSRECVYLNILTKESKALCVELSVQGFRVSCLIFLYCISLCLKAVFHNHFLVVDKINLYLLF